MAQSNAERQKAYRERNGATVTEPRIVTDRNGWEWDEHHVYQRCAHGCRYCLKCGTAVIRPANPTPDQWSLAHRMILQGQENARTSNARSRS